MVHFEQWGPPVQGRVPKIAASGAGSATNLLHPGPDRGLKVLRRLAYLSRAQDP